MSDPASFQFPAGISTSSTPRNVSARLDPYTAPGTLRNIQQPGGADLTPTPPPSGSKTLGDVRPFYAEDGVAEKDTP